MQNYWFKTTSNNWDCKPPKTILKNQTWTSKAFQFVFNPTFSKQQDVDKSKYEVKPSNVYQYDLALGDSLSNENYKIMTK